MVWEWEESWDFGKLGSNEVLEVDAEKQESRVSGGKEVPSCPKARG